MTAAFFTKLKDLTQISLSSNLHKCVLSVSIKKKKKRININFHFFFFKVPFYFTEAQRHSLLCAAKIAQLDLVDIINENTAVGLAYGVYKSDSIPSTEKDQQKIVAFVDVGHSSCQATLAAFSTQKVSVNYFFFF